MDFQESNPMSSPIDVEFDESTVPVKRKNKSLLALCKRFLQIYPLDMPQGSSLDIPLEHLSERLKLSRRRLYDIINIMESLQMAVKVTKNLYRWYGTRNVQALLTQIKDMSDREMCGDLIQLPCLSSAVSEITQNGEPMQPPCTPQGDMSAHALLMRSMAQLSQPPSTPQGQLMPMAPPTPLSSTKKRQCTLNNMKESPEPKKPDHWKMKSLGGTCLKFLALFFKHETVSLDWAGKVLLCGDDDDKPSAQESDESNSKEQDRQLRNKVRRIYDVANVLCALGLVCKISPQYRASRKLLYAYSGPAIGDLKPSVPAGFIAETDNASMEPPKPSRRVKKLDLQIEEESREQRQTMEGVCKRRLDLGKVQESPHCKRLLQDDSLLEESGTCALSILLAVAERELKEFTSPKPDTPSSTATQTANAIKYQPTPPAVSAVPSPTTLEPKFSIMQPKYECNQISNLSEQDYISPTKENEQDSNNITVSKPVINQPILCNNGNRSALRSLLENNRTAPVKSEFPIIKKFVVLNEENLQSRVNITPAIRPPIQTVVIRNVSGACQLMRRNGLSIPWQLNIPTIASRNIVTHLDIGLGKPSLPQ